METTNKIVLLDIDDTLFNTKRFKDSELTHYSLYKEVPDALETLSHHALLGILSQGETDFQLKKLQNTDIYDYFSPENVHIFVQKHLAYQSVFAQYTEMDAVFFVEDRLDQLAAAKKKTASITTVWMKRGRYIKSQEKSEHFVPDYIITNLSELIPLVV